MPFVYILECSDSSYYVGSTGGSLEDRIEQHALGKGSAYTSNRTPVRLMFAEEFDSVADAYAVERRLHGWSRAKKEALMRGDFDAIKVLARGRSRRSTDP